LVKVTAGSPGETEDRPTDFANAEDRRGNEYKVDRLRSHRGIRSGSVAGHAARLSPWSSGSRSASTGGGFGSPRRVNGPPPSGAFDACCRQRTRFEWHSQLRLLSSRSRSLAIEIRRIGHASAECRASARRQREHVHHLLHRGGYREPRLLSVDDGWINFVSLSG
jgi:hypothetical protein